VRLRDTAVDAYAARLGALLERHGIALSRPAPGAPIEVLEADDGSLSFELIGSLPDGRRPALATLELRESFSAAGDGTYERDRYEYELIDRERDFRRAFHLHVPEWFARRYLVVVHEHCERPIGHSRCRHYEGAPVRDGYAGVVVLMDAWTGEPPDCESLPCLE